MAQTPSLKEKKRCVKLGFKTFKWVWLGKMRVGFGKNGCGLGRV